VVTGFGKQEDAAVGYNPRYRGKRSYDPWLCIEANSSYLWDAELRPGNAGTWDGAVEVLDTCFANVPPDIRELRVRADAGFGFDPGFVALEAQPAQYAVVARLTTGLKRLLPGLSYHSVNRHWEMAEFEHCLHGWPQARRFVVARRFLEPEEAETTLFALGRYIYRAWVTNLPLTPAGIWYFYDGRAGIEPRIRELREDFALRKIPTASFAANALFLEIIRLAYNLVTAFQRSCLDDSWQALTLQKLRYKLFLIPGELTRPQNRPVLRLRPSPMIEDLTEKIIRKVGRVKPLGS
jgi:DDE family transposase